MVPLIEPPRSPAVVGKGASPCGVVMLYHKTNWSWTIGSLFGGCQAQYLLRTTLLQLQRNVQFLSNSTYFSSNNLKSMVRLCHSSWILFSSSIELFAAWRSAKTIHSTKQVIYELLMHLSFRITSLTRRLNIIFIMFNIIVLFIITMFARFYVRVGILLTWRKHFYDRIVSQRVDVWANTTNLSHHFIFKYI